MKPFPIPVVAFGPGSQPEDEPLQYISSPGAMSIFEAPAPRHAAPPEVVAAARSMLEGFLARMEAGGYGAADVQLDLDGVEPEVVDEVNELLGHGEVSALVGATRPVRIQETAFAGVWRVQTLREDGALASDRVEAAPMPAAVTAALARVPPRTLSPDEVAPGVMNAPAMLVELEAAAAAWRPGGEAHVINLTLLPVSPEDLECLAAQLGGGPVTILSRGYGNCRVSSTALPYTWWVQYFNSTDQLILNTIEVVDVPAVALAAAEDYADSIERLREWIATL